MRRQLLLLRQNLQRQRERIADGQAITETRTKRKNKNNEIGDVILCLLPGASYCT